MASRPVLVPDLNPVYRARNRFSLERNHSFSVAAVNTTPYTAGPTQLADLASQFLIFHDPPGPLQNRPRHLPLVGHATLGHVTLGAYTQSGKRAASQHTQRSCNSHTPHVQQPTSAALTPEHRDQRTTRRTKGYGAQYCNCDSMPPPLAQLSRSFPVSVHTVSMHTLHTARAVSTRRSPKPPLGPLKTQSSNRPVTLLPISTPVETISTSHSKGDPLRASEHRPVGTQPERVRRGPQCRPVLLPLGPRLRGGAAHVHPAALCGDGGDQVEAAGRHQLVPAHVALRLRREGQQRSTSTPSFVLPG